MNPLRIHSSEVVDTTGFVEAAYADAGTVSVTTTGVTAATEVQLIDVTLEEAVYKLDYDGTSVTTASLDSTPTIAELVTAIQGAAGYGSLPFTVAAGTGDQLALTWATAVTVPELATLVVTGKSAGSTAETVAGDGSTAEVQTVSSVTVTDGKAYTLDFDGTLLTTAPLDANVGQGAVIDEIIDQLQADADYLGLGVHIAKVSATSFTVTWQAVGAIAYTVALTFSDYSAGTAVVDTAGATAATEVRSVTPTVLDPLSLYQLTLQDVVLTGAAADASPTVAEIVALINADADYAAAPFTIAESGGAIVATWKAAGTIAAPSTPDVFEYKARVEGPYSAVMASGITTVRVAPIVACHVAIGVNAEATTASTYMPAGSVEYFKTAPGERVSVIAASSDGNVSVAQMTY